MLTNGLGETQGLIIS